MEPVRILKVVEFEELEHVLSVFADEGVGLGSFFHVSERLLRDGGEFLEHLF